VDVNVPVDAKDIDDAYDDAWAVLSTKAPKVNSKPDEETRVQDRCIYSVLLIPNEKLTYCIQQLQEHQNERKTL